MTKDRDECVGMALIVTAALFFGLFFGLLYPEILRTQYTPATCYATNAIVKSRYCCTTGCSTCTTLSGGQACITRQETIEGLDPRQCNSSDCLGSLACDGGYHCCATSCSTCQSCTTKDGKTRCTRHSCNCYCSVWTNHLACSLTCDLCYTTIIYFTYKDRTGQSESASLSYNYDRNLQAAETKLSEFSDPNHPIKCWYNPSTYSEIVLSIDYSLTAILVTTFIGIIPFWFVLMCISHFTLVDLHQDRYVFHNVVFWVCFIPFLVCICLYGVHRVPGSEIGAGFCAAFGFFLELYYFWSNRETEKKPELLRYEPPLPTATSATAQEIPIAVEIPKKDEDEHYAEAVVLST